MVHPTKPTFLIVRQFEIKKSVYQQNPEGHRKLIYMRIKIPT